MKKKRLFTGSGVAIVTPFKGEAIDFTAFRRIIDFQIASGTQAIIVCGTTGEAATLSAYERQQIIAHAVRYVAGRVPIIAGSGSNATAQALELSRSAVAEGVDGLLLVTPYYNKTTQNGALAHYLKIAESVDCPQIIYNVPSRTGFNILPQTYQQLGEHPNIVAVKEANGNIAAAAQSISLCGDSLDFYCGNDGEILPFLALGGIGVISVIANILPRETAAICETYFEGKIEESRHLQLSLMAVCEALFCETNPIPVKYAMKLFGLCSGELRLPLLELSAEQRPFVENALKEAGIAI